MDDSRRARQLHVEGQVQRAESLYRSALAADPQDLSLRRDLGALLMQTGRPSEAIAVVDQPGVMDSADEDLLVLLALALRAVGNLERTVEVAARITGRSPSSAMGWLALGSAQARLGAHRDAETSLRRCVALDPGLGEAWHYLGQSRQAQGRWDDAIAAYTESARDQPAEIFNIAQCHERAGRLRAALEGYAAAHAMFPSRADMLARLAQVQAMLCLHADEAESTARLARLLEGPLADDDHPEPFLFSWLDVDERIKSTTLRRYSRRVQRSIEPLPALPRKAADPSRRIRLGYISADFGPHAVGSLVRGHFAAHDRDRFVVSGYSLRAHSGEIAEEIRAGFDHFHECSPLGDAAVAGRIRDDGLDVLIDMSGFTDGARPAVLALRPAPLQLGWLGFIHGHNAPWLDGLLLDGHVHPPGAAWPYDDRVIRLEGTLLPGAPGTPGQPDRARFGLPDGVPVLASFNNAYKLTPALIQAWCEILQRAPDAQLAVYLPPEARTGFLRQWTSFSGPADRLHLVDKLPLEAHSDRLASCDLLLDSFRYQGGATSMDAVQNGLPVLALAGGTPLSRLSVGINGFLGLEELVCGDVATYVDRAASLANCPHRLDGLRHRVRERAAASGLFDPRRAALSIEKAVCKLLGRGPWLQ